MPNTEFTKAFASMQGSVEGAMNGALVSNFSINLLLSGSMSLLWGLLHSTQILAHFPLINIMMPQNADMLFTILMKIATFDLIPTEAVIDDMQVSMGIVDDNFILSDNFESYGFDSTGPIRNL